MKTLPDINRNHMTPRLFVLLAIYCWANGFGIGLMVAYMMVAP